MIVFSKPVRHAATAVKIAVVTGLSRPDRCVLSAVQREFLDGIRAPRAWKIPWNFPWIPCPGRDAALPSLWIAALRNGAQFCSARRPRYRRAARGHWLALEESCERLVIVTGSCGLEILNQCLEGGRPVRPLHVFALGPVARSRPEVPHTLVQGSRDRISRWFFPVADVVLPGVGHMEYFGHPYVLSLVNAHLCGNTSISQERGSTFRA